LEDLAAHKLYAVDEDVADIAERADVVSAACVHIVAETSLVRDSPRPGGILVAVWINDRRVPDWRIRRSFQVLNLRQEIKESLHSPVGAATARTQSDQYGTAAL
jgi:hypothetical protein